MNMKIKIITTILKRKNFIENYNNKNVQKPQFNKFIHLYYIFTFNKIIINHFFINNFIKFHRQIYH